MHRRLLVIGVLIAAMFATAAPAGSSDNQGAMIHFLRGQVSQLKQQRAAWRVTHGSLLATVRQGNADLKAAKKTQTDTAAQLTQAQADLAARTTERDGATAALAAAQADALASVLAQPPTTLWTTMQSIWRLMPNTTCGFSKSLFTDTGYSSYTFTLFAC